MIILASFSKIGNVNLYNVFSQINYVIAIKRCWPLPRHSGELLAIENYETQFKSIQSVTISDVLELSLIISVGPGKIERCWKCVLDSAFHWEKATCMLLRPSQPKWNE